ncbi:response regulator [Desulfovibrio subterraneus]|uniref:response regulator n=1 Tax=Desulfovibrio subterraneus TaxID=2718620 RepID=UPI0022B870E3|nr:response regulator [Desulfovibrio subterraneus]WBF66976.1 response regulator [Desulfovibrio subterraneus]
MSLSILVVDDEQIVALDIRRTLERLGYAVPAIVADGETSISKASELRPSLVLMDIRLKGEMDGIQAASIITGKLNIPVIYLTAYSDEATLERAKASNPFGFLIKPFEERELHSTIEIALLKHRSERNLDEARRRAEQDNLAKSGYFADMSHEIRNSLNGIVGMTDLALDTDLSTEQREYLSTVLDSAEHLLSILNDVLDISRIEARKLSLTERPFELAGCVSKAVRTVRPDAEKKGLQLEWRIAPDVPKAMVGDAGRLQQILLNLLGNAIKFTASGGISVEVNTVQDATGPAIPHAPGRQRTLQLLFSVRDTGMGIPEDRQTSIFERYRQVDREGPQDQVGSGLGLAICKELIELMEGAIWVRSRVDHGSTFYFTARLAPTDQPQPERETGAPLLPVEKHLHVLAVDDNLVSRKLLRLLLEKQGHTCVTACNGLEMLAHLAQERFDLVLTNIQMPRMGGLEAVRRIRSGIADGVPQDIPIIAVTAHALKGDRERFLEAGMTDYIAKPIHAARFYRAINRAIHREASPAEDLPPQDQQRLLHPILDTAGVLERMDGDVTLVREIWQAFLADSADQMLSVRETLRGSSPRLDLTLTEVAIGAAQALQTAARNVGALELSVTVEQCITALRFGERERAEAAIMHVDTVLRHTQSVMDTSMKSLSQPEGETP